MYYISVSFMHIFGYTLNLLIMKTIKFIHYLLFLIVTVNGFSQNETRTGIYKYGNAEYITAIATKPECWVNEANEFNVLITTEDKMILLTMLNGTNPEIGRLPEFDRVMFTKYSFVLHTPENENYYFATESQEEKQMKELLYDSAGFKKSYYGYGIAKHEIPLKNLDKKYANTLKAAKSVYDVL